MRGGKERGEWLGGGTKGNLGSAPGLLLKSLIGDYYRASVLFVMRAHSWRLSVLTTASQTPSWHFFHFGFNFFFV
jgi:hypothetical protein